ncbi:MAG: twin-arginine translocation signal domain-containing protein, partial [Raoultibacter sp.]
MSGTEKLVSTGLTRRNFLKTTGAIAGVAAVGSGLLGLSTKDTACAGGVSSNETKTIVGACMRSGCFVCQHNIDVRDGHVVKVWAKE